MTSSVLAPPDLVAPRFRSVPSRDWTEGALVADLVSGCFDDKGPFVLDPEQRLIVDAVFGYRMSPPSRFVARSAPRLSVFEVTVVAPRQNLKTGALKAIALGKIFISEQRLVVWTSHRGTACVEAYREIKLLIESNPDLLAEVAPGGFHSSANNLSIEFVGDRRMLFMTRTADAAQSFAGDTVIIDEAYKLEMSFVASLAPTLAARPDPQIVYASSAGHVGSVALRALRERGRSGDDGLAYLEWSATPRPCAEEECSHRLDARGCFLDDEDAWLECNTAVHRGRMLLETLHGLRRTFAADPMKFGREMMCLWEDPAGDADADHPLDPNLFAECADRGSRIAPDAERVFVLHVGHRRQWACVVAAGRRADGRIHVEIPAARGRQAHWRGTRDVVRTFRRLRKRFDGAPVRILGKSQAAPFAAKLIELGFEVELVQPGEYPAMCTGLVDAVESGQVAHLGDDVLVSSVRDAGSVDVGEEQWRWRQVASGSYVGPTVAMTLAVDAVLHDEGTAHGLGIW